MIISRRLAIVIWLVISLSLHTTTVLTESSFIRHHGGYECTSKNNSSFHTEVMWCVLFSKTDWGKC